MNILQEGDYVYRAWHNSIRRYTYGCKYTLGGIDYTIIINRDGYEEKIENFDESYSPTEKGAWQLELAKVDKEIEKFEGEVSSMVEKLKQMKLRYEEIEKKCR